MSKIGDVLIDIEERLMADEEPADIARALNVPLQWVLDQEKYLLACDDPRNSGPNYEEY